MLGPPNQLHVIHPLMWISFVAIKPLRGVFNNLKTGASWAFCTVTEPAYPRIMRLFYQHMYISDEAPGVLCSLVDRVELVVTLALIAEVLYCSMDPINAEQFPVFTRELTIPALVTEFYEGR